MEEAGEDGFVLEDLYGAIVAQGRTKHDPTHRRPFLLKAAIIWVRLQWYEEESSEGVVFAEPWRCCRRCAISLEISFPTEPGEPTPVLQLIL